MKIKAIMRKEIIKIISTVRVVTIIIFSIASFAEGIKDLNMIDARCVSQIKIAYTD